MSRRPEDKPWKKTGKKILLALLCAAALLSCTTPGQAFWQRAANASGFTWFQGEDVLLEIHVIDVGKADAILIRSRGKTALLDGGYFVSGGDVTDYLLRQGVEKLDYVVLSHPDRDHAGGLGAVMEKMKTAAFVRGPLGEELIPDERGIRELRERIAKDKIPRVILEPGESVSLGGAKLTALGPLGEYKETNNSSLVLRLECGGFSALFCGDIEKKAEADLVQSGQELSATLLKVAHHGSKTSSTEEFVRRVSPEYAVVSVGQDISRLPREEALSNLEAVGAEIYRTDIDGNVIFVYDGKDIEVKTEK